MEIPVIDMQGNEVSKLREACEKWGCFRVVNHGVPIDLMADMKAVAIDFFDRPVEIKRRNKEIIPGSGYVALDVFEALGLDVTSSECLSSFCSDLEAKAHQRETIEKYYQALQKLVTDVAKKMAESMGLEDDTFKVHTSHFRMNKYNITPENRGSHSLPKHTDSSLITILQDDENFRGLEVLDPSGNNFVAVDPSPGTFCVILGDVAVAWSNGKLRNAQHRVVCQDVGTRFSIVAAGTPANDEVIVAHPKFLTGDDCQPKYAPFKYEDFKTLRGSKKLYCGEAIEHMRLIN